MRLWNVALERLLGGSDRRTITRWSFHGERPQLVAGIRSARRAARNHWHHGCTPEGRTTFAAPKYGLEDLPAARIIATSPGGGGWSDPFRRNQERLALNVVNGVVSVQASMVDYGVVVDDRGGRTAMLPTRSVHVAGDKPEVAGVRVGFVRSDPDSAVRAAWRNLLGPGD